jgi:hypothetical protein
MKRVFTEARNLNLEYKVGFDRAIASGPQELPEEQQKRAKKAAQENMI